MKHDFAIPDWDIGDQALSRAGRKRRSPSACRTPAASQTYTCTPHASMMQGYDSGRMTDLRGGARRRRTRRPLTSAGCFTPSPTATISSPACCRSAATAAGRRALVALAGVAARHARARSRRAAPATSRSRSPPAAPASPPRHHASHAAARVGASRRRSRAVAFVTGDMMALPFPDATFDLVTTGYGIRNVPRDRAGARRDPPRAAARRAAPVARLRPAGERASSAPSTSAI